MTAQAYLRHLPRPVAARLEAADPAALREFSLHCVRTVAGPFTSSFEEDLARADATQYALLVDDLDAAALFLQEQEAPRPEYLRAFAMARAATAVLALMREPDPLAAAARVAYECHAARGSWVPVVRAVRATLCGLLSSARRGGSDPLPRANP